MYLFIFKSTGYNTYLDILLVLMMLMWLMLLILLMWLMLLTPEGMIGRGDDTSHRRALAGLLLFSWRISKQEGVPVHCGVSGVGDVKTSGSWCYRRGRRGIRPTE